MALQPHELGTRPARELGTDPHAERQKVIHCAFGVPRPATYGGPHLGCHPRPDLACCRRGDEICILRAMTPARAGVMMDGGKDTPPKRCADVMDSTCAGRDAATAHKHGVGMRRTSRTVHAFWIVLDDPVWGSPLKVVSADGTEAIALFGGEEEARMFCRFHEQEAAPAIRQTTAGEVISLLYCPGSARHVVLDPLPGIPGCEPPGPPALSRTRFTRRFAGPESVPSSVVPGHDRVSRHPVRTRARVPRGL